jgi:hypothetical protein
MDLHIGIISINSSTLQEFHVARRDIEKFEEVAVRGIMGHTCDAPFEMKLEVWISTLAPLIAVIAPP